MGLLLLSTKFNFFLSYSFALDGFLHDLRFTNLAVVKQRILNLGDDGEK